MDTKLIAFSSQKGGAGKSSFTALAASYFSYVTNKKVCVIDADFPQYSIVHMRARDLKLIQDEQEAYFRQLVKVQMAKTGNSYPILKSLPQDVLSLIETIKLKEQTFDYIFIDMPGTLNNTGIIKNLAAMDYVFTPLVANEVELDSALGFVKFIQQKIAEGQKFRLKAIYPFWNKYNASEKNPLYKVYNKTIADLGIKILKTTIPNTVKFNKEVSMGCRTHFICTLLPPHKKMIEDSRIPALFDEILTHITK